MNQATDNRKTALRPRCALDFIRRGGEDAKLLGEDAK